MSSAARPDGSRIEPDVYTEIRSLATRLGAGRVIELGCGTGSGLVSLHPGLGIVGIDDPALITRCRRSYGVGEWIETDAEGAVELPDRMLERAILLLSAHGARHEGSLDLARAALARGVLAVVVSVSETDGFTAADFHRMLARHRLDAFVGRTAFDTLTLSGTAMLAVVAGTGAPVRESVASWWSERQPWERQLTRFAELRGPGPTPSIDHNRSGDLANTLRVAVITESSGADQEALRRTGQSLVAQTFESWSWSVVCPPDVRPPLDDDRIKLVHEPTRAMGMATASADADFVALVDEGLELRETALEKWLWFLATHPTHQGATANDRSRTEACLLRKEAIVAAGGVDAAWATANSIGHVPHTCSEDGSADEPGDGSPMGDLASSPRSWISETIPFRTIRRSRTRRAMLIAPWMTLGGADHFNLEALGGLRDAGWDVCVATTRPADHALYGKFEEITADLFPLADVVPLRDYPRMLDYLIDSRRPRVVVVSQSELGYRLLPYLRSRRREPAFVDLCHSEVDDWWAGGFPRFSIAYRSLLDRTIVVSEHLRDWMIERGALQDRIAVCRANVDHVLFAPNPGARERVRRRLRLADHEAVVLWVGRMSSEKRPRLLPSISAALRGLGIDHTLVVVGDGPERRPTEELAAAEGDSRLVFYGEHEYAELPDIYAASDVLVLPSRVEGIALTLFEALSSGVPVVTADIGGQSELVTEDVGMLVEPSPEASEIDRYAEALAAVLRDPVRRASMGHAARARIEGHFTRAAMNDRFERILEDAVEQHVRAPCAVPDVRLGRALASEAIELVRLAMDTAQGPDRLGRRERLYEVAQRIGGPAYRWANEHDVPGLRTARDLAHRAVVGR